MTIIEKDNLFLGLGIETLLLISLISLLYFILKIKPKSTSTYAVAMINKTPVWLSLLFIIISMVLVYKGLLSKAVISFG